MAKAKASKPSAKPSKDAAPVGSIEKLMELMGKHRIAELEWESDEGRVVLRTQVAGTMMAQMPYMAHAPSPAPQTAPASSAPAAKPAPESKGKQITSPFVGTFYRAPSPTAEPYIREGQTVKRGDTLCIIEAMKLMNPIESEVSGKIVSILVENGQPVEFGEPLFVIE